MALLSRKMACAQPGQICPKKDAFESSACSSNYLELLVHYFSDVKLCKKMCKSQTLNLARSHPFKHVRPWFHLDPFLLVRIQARKISPPSLGSSGSPCS